MPILVVTTPAQTPILLTTLAAVKQELEIADDSSDAWLTNVIARQSQRIQSYCERVFAIETVTETFYADRGVPQTDLTPAWERLGGTRRPSLRLQRTPVIGTPAVTLSPASADPVTLTVATDFIVDAARGVLTRLGTTGRPIFWSPCETAVTYTAGFALPGEQERTLPVDLEDACIQLVKGRWHGRRRDPQLKSETIDMVGSQTFWVPNPDDPAMPAEVVETLDLYRRV